MKADEWFKRMHQVVENASSSTEKKPEKEIELDAIREWERKKEEEEEKIQQLKEERRLKTEGSSH